MSTDKQHMALPRLYGAPAHTPRRMVVPHADPALDPDDLPIETYRSSEDDALALQLFPRSYGGQVIEAGPRATRPFLAEHYHPELTPRPLLLRALAGRLLHPKGH